ncbi:hypothetical protein C8T65DRAFT_829201 [Cerioporus squamosus]|nr:hypothetical protein C8T65DRAFT_829201 [Cerioporus squamosus]
MFFSKIVTFIAVAVAASAGVHGSVVPQARQACEVDYSTVTVFQPVTSSTTSTFTSTVTSQPILDKRQDTTDDPRGDQHAYRSDTLLTRRDGDLH